MDFDQQFMKLCLENREIFSNKAIENQFKTLENNKARIEAVHEMAKRHPCLSSFFERTRSLHQKELVKPLKSSILSEDLRAKGNNFSKRKESSRATSSYNRSIFWAEGESLALAYADRSLFFYETGDLLHSLRDVEFALVNNYPKHLEYELRDRQGDCWSKLNQKQLAINSYCIARDSINTHQVHDPSKLENVLAKLRKLGPIDVHTQDPIDSISLIEKMIKEKRNVIPTLFGDQNPLNPSASTVVRIHDEMALPNRGRCLTAAQDLKPGMNVIVERPYCLILEKQYKENHCNYCVYWTPGPISCLRCSQVGYCSVECREKAWTSYHQFECGFVELLEKTDVNETALLSLRTVLMLEQEILVKSQTVEKVSGSNDYEMFHRLIDHTSHRNRFEIFRRSIMAVFLVGLVRGEFNLKLSTELLHLLLCLPYYVESINQMFLPPASCPAEASQVEAEIVGASFLPVCGLMNNSCDPNVTRLCYGDTTVIKVIRPIKSGEELLDNYGYHYYGHPKELRQSKLKEKYFFDCKCRPCVENWPHLNSIPSLGRRHRLFHPILKDLCLFSKYQCFFSDNMGKNLTELKKWDEKFLKHLNSIDADRTIRRPVIEYSEVQEALKQCCDLMATTSPKMSTEMMNPLDFNMIPADLLRQISNIDFGKRFELMSTNLSFR